MDVLIRDLDKKTVREIKKKAVENKRSLQAELKAILDNTAAQRRHLRKWNKKVDRIYEELSKSGHRFPDSTGLIREDRRR